MTAVYEGPVPEDEVALAREALPVVKKYLAEPTKDAVVIAVEGDPDGRVQRLPRKALELLGSILANLAAGRPVQIIPGHAELTTQQAAEILNVSRPFLIGLLTAGEINYRMVGTHRRVTAESLLQYMREDDARRRSSADELTRLSEEMGTL